MYSLKSLALEFEITDEALLALLGEPRWHLENGLHNYQFNEPMRDYLLKLIATALASSAALAHN